MYLIVIAWLYVVLMMSVAEATNTTGTVLGALMTFVLYGVGPLALVVYLMGAPARGKARKQREAAEAAGTGTENPASADPDTGGHAPGGAETVAPGTGVAPVRKEP